MTDLNRARSLVISDPDIMGGNSVFKGTQIPAHAIAIQLGEGDGLADILAAYPRLTEEVAVLAPIYAAAYPLDGRRHVQPWHGQDPIAVTRRKLSSV